MAEVVDIDSSDEVEVLEDDEVWKATVGDEASVVASLQRKYGLTVPTYISNDNRAISSTNKGPYRSVLDFSSTKVLTTAMLDMGDNYDTTALDPFLQQIGNGEPIQTILSETEEEIVDALDWLLPTFDPECMEPQTMDEEVKRLMVLKCYRVLDQEREDAFDRITGLAARIFDVSVACLSLIDLGRLWLLSTTGWGDIREIPRKVTFCAHTINCKDIVMVVPDARLDFRFRDNPWVTGPPHIRFYAGVALVSPEGYKLGDFCVWDTVPHPDGLTSEEQDTLRDMADMTVKVMVDRRYQLEKKKEEEEAQRQQQEREEEQRGKSESGQSSLLTAHKMMTLLSGLQLSLSLLKEDKMVQSVLREEQLELINAAASTANIAVRMCRDSEVSNTAPAAAPASAPASWNSSLLTEDAELSVDPFSTNVKETRISELVKSVRIISAPVETDAPLLISVDKFVPPVVVMDEVKVFRSVLYLMESAIERTTEGMIRLSIRAESGRIVFECADTGHDIPKDKQAGLFLPSKAVPSMCTGGVPGSALSSGMRPCLFGGAGDPVDSVAIVAALVDSMDGGKYGFRPSDSGESGSVLWFSIPLELPINSSSSAAKAASEGYDSSSRKRTHSGLC